MPKERAKSILYFLIGLGNLRSKNNKHEEALEYFQQAYELNPKDLSANLKLASELVHLGRDSEAEEAYQFILATNPKQIFALMGLGNLRSKNNKHEEALEYFHQAYDANSEDIGVSLRFIKTLRRLHRFSEAEIICNIVSERNPMIYLEL